jgi:Na+/proline symporter
MNELDRTFRNKLLDVEKTNATYKQRYEKEVRAMFEKKLSYLGRAGFAALAVVGLLAALPFADLAFSKVGAGMGFYARVVTVPGLVLALAWAVLMGWVAIRGKLSLRTLPPRIASIGIVLGFFCIVLYLFVFIVPITRNNPTDWRSIFGIQLALIAFFFLVTIGLCVVLRILYRTQFQTREKLLEIEYRIAELAEKVESKSSK